jgi:hypothetical protein
MQVKSLCWSAQVTAVAALKYSSSDSASAPGKRSGGFDKGRWPVRWLAIGLASGLPALARSGPSRGFPCQIRRGPVELLDGSGPKVLLPSRQPTGAGAAVAERQWERRRARRGGGACGSSGPP